MRRIDIFVSSPEDVQLERSLVERTIRAVAGEFSVPVTVTYSNWLRRLDPSDKVAAQSANGSEDGRTWLCPCFWEYRDSEMDQEYREQIPNTGSYDLVISILWSRLGTRLSPAFVMPDGSQPKTANEYEIAWVLDQLNRTPGFPELRIYRNRSSPPQPPQSKPRREEFFREWDAVQEFFAAWEKEKAFTDGCSSYSDLQEFESLFRAHFRDFLNRQLEKEIVPRKQPARGHYWQSEPFRGLQYFDFEHAPIFHGRTKAVGDVIDALAKQANAKTPFVLVLGASGSGKSSLIRAGVLPLLTEVGTMKGEGPWRHAITRPSAGGDPFDSLAASLLAPMALPELRGAKMRNDWRKLATDLKDSPEKVALRIKELIDRISAEELDRLLNREEDQTPVPGRIESVELARHRKLRRVNPKAQLALFIDQLEELFTSGFSLELQHQYLAAIAALVRCQSVFVIAVLGSDYYTNYQQFPELVSLTHPGGRFDLQPPTRAELEKMVRSPAEVSGLSFEREAKTGLALDDALLDAALVADDQLPLLEHVLSMLYRKQAERGDGLLRWSDYREMGEFVGALTHHVEKVFTELSSDARQTFGFVMRRLAPVELDEKACGRTAFYRDLVSSPELDSRLRAGAKNLVDSMVKEGLLTSETDFRQQTVIRVSHSALFRKWARVREWLIEDQEFLRMRDRVEGCLKLWLKRGRQKQDLLSPSLCLADGETLLNHFQSSLSNIQIEYIHKSLVGQKRGRRLRYMLLLPLFVALALLAGVVGVRWFNDETLETSTQEFGKLERKIVELAKSGRVGNQTELERSEEKAQLAEHDAELSAQRRTAMEAQLKKAQELAKQYADLALAQRSTSEGQLQQVQDKLQRAQQNADQASNERAALVTQLGQAQDKLQKAQQNVNLPSNERAALENQLKQAQDKLQQVQQNADLAANQRVALEAQLKQAQDQLLKDQQNADLAANQRAASEAQLKEAQDKLQKAQQNADLASNQRADFETQLKQAQDKLQKAQQNADSILNQHADLEARLKEAQDKLQKAQQNADSVLNQRADLETQLKEAQDKLQKAQQNADSVSSRRADLETQLKQAQDKLQQGQQNAGLAAAVAAQLKEAQDKLQKAQQNADLFSNQRADLETQLKQAHDQLQQGQQNVSLVADLETHLKEAQDKLQKAQQNADLAANQHADLETQLKEAQDKLQQGQQNVDLVSNQRADLETQLKQAQDQLQKAQQNANLVSNQRADLETQLKQAQDQLQKAQQNANLVSSQSADLEIQLKQAQDKLQQGQQSAGLAAALEAQLKEAQDKLQKAQDKLQKAQQNADLVSNQRADLETQLKQAQDKLQQGQQNAGLVVTLEAQLKEAQDKLQKGQQKADLASSQRADLEARLQKAEENLQVTQQRADLATTQRTALETQLRQAEEKAQLAQKIADLVAAQAHPDEDGTSKAQGAKKNVDTANQPRSGRALPLDAGQIPEPGITTQPLLPPVEHPK
jgi:chromosome segregation ATPase